jgi:hypothetical protein
VLARRNQLQAMLEECNGAEEAANNFTARINEIEKKMDNLPDVSFGTDTLKRQKSEYKVNIHEKSIQFFLLEQLIKLRLSKHTNEGENNLIINVN